MDDLMERKAKKQGKVTPTALAESLLRAIESGEVESVVIVSKNPDGTIKTGWSHENHLVSLGMLEVAKNDVIVDMLG